MGNEPITTDPPGVDTPVPDEPTTADPSPAQDDPPASATPDKDGVQKRIDTLTRKRFDAERDAAYWKGVAESKPAPALAEKDPESASELDPVDFDSNDDYLKAFAKQTREEIRSEAAAEKAATQAEESQREAVKQYDKGRSKYEDFDAVALSQGTHSVTQDMLDAARGENLSEILYQLGKNHVEADRIASLPPIQQIKEIGKIESRITAGPLPKTITKAPNPPAIVRDGGSPLSIPDEDKSQAELNVEWEKERRAELGVK